MAAASHSKEIRCLFVWCLMPGHTITSNSTHPRPSLSGGDFKSADMPTTNKQ